MLDIGRGKVSAASLDGTVTLEQGDAQDLKGLYATDSFDAASIAFGIRNIPNRVRALREMGRVVKPGGAVGVLEFSEPREGILAPAARFFVNHVLPRLGAVSLPASFRSNQRKNESCDGHTDDSMCSFWWGLLFD